MTGYGTWYELQLEASSQKQKNLLGIKLSKFLPMALNHFSECIKIMGTDCPWNIPPNSVFVGLLLYTLLSVF